MGFWVDLVPKFVGLSEVELASGNICCMMVIKGWSKTSRGSSSLLQNLIGLDLGLALVLQLARDGFDIDRRMCTRGARYRPEFVQEPDAEGGKKDVDSALRRRGDTDIRQVERD